MSIPSCVMPPTNTRNWYRIGVDRLQVPRHTMARFGLATLPNLHSRPSVSAVTRQKTDCTCEVATVPSVPRTARRPWLRSAPLARPGCAQTPPTNRSSRTLSSVGRPHPPIKLRALPSLLASRLDSTYGGLGIKLPVHALQRLVHVDNVGFGVQQGAHITNGRTQRHILVSCERSPREVSGVCR